MAFWGPDGSDIRHAGSAAFGQFRLFNTPEARYERLPAWVPPSGQVTPDASGDPEGGAFLFTAKARLDNRDELCARLDIPAAERERLPDGDLMACAYARWGEACVERLLGDWACAAWHPAERALFVARDQHGITSLFYTTISVAPGSAPTSGVYFSFASSVQALWALDKVLNITRPLDEIRLAQVLTSWPGDGTRTMREGIHALPGGHFLCVKPSNRDARGSAPTVERRRYWRLEDTPILHLPSSEAYVEGLRDVLDRAVRDRLRSLRPIGVTLSGGLDSGSVTVLAARALSERGERLTSFTSVPLYPPAQGRNIFGDEREYASLTAASNNAIDPHYLDCRQTSPLAGVRRALAVYGSPSHASSNAYWLNTVMRECNRLGIGTLLTGQGGNAGISWAGMPPDSPLALLRLGWRRAALRALIRRTPFGPLVAARERAQQKRALDQAAWTNYSAIRPDFARRIDLAGLMAADDHDPSFSRHFSDPREARYRIISPGKDGVGPLWALNGALHNLEVRDPTNDIRVLAYCLSVPDAEYTGPRGEGRYLLRCAMSGLLPDPVLWNTRRGLQAADLLPRLRAHASEMEETLRQLEAAPVVGEYIDLARMRTVWQNARSDTGNTFWKETVTVLMRGIMAGLFLAELSA